MEDASKLSFKFMGCRSWKSAMDRLDGMLIKVTESFSFYPISHSLYYDLHDIKYRVVEIPSGQRYLCFKMAL